MPDDAPRELGPLDVPSVLNADVLRAVEDLAAAVAALHADVRRLLERADDA